MNRLKNSEYKYSEKLCITTAQKLSREGNNAFSLIPGPNLSCPGATESCKSCYACKGRHVFNNVSNAHLNNFVHALVATKDKKLRTNFIDTISKVLSNKSLFRIHESGDFFSQEYLNIWNIIIGAHKSTKFWFYTRNFNLKYDKILSNSNVIGYISIDDYNIKAANSLQKKYPKFKLAYGPVTNEQATELITNNTVICPLTNGKTYSQLRCSECKICISGSKNVIFIKH